MFRSRSQRRALPALVLATGLALTATACTGAGGGDDDGGSTADAKPLVVWAGSQTPIVANYNPFSPTVLHGALGPIYETMFHYNKATGGEPDPLLGESFEFNEDGTAVTVTLKQDVTWSDGEPFTADDVVFTFQHDLVQPTYITSVEATDDHTVEFTFDGPQFTNESNVLGGQRIIPEHIWKDVADAATFTDEDPVGTGPYIVESTSEASYTLVANPEYRDGEVAVKKIQYLGIDANQSAEDLIRTGRIDWTTMFVPEPESLTEAGTIGYLNTPQDPTVLYTCSDAAAGCTGPQTDVAVRQALDLAIDRGTINERAFVGHAGVISPTYALLPRDENWIADGMPSESPQSADVAAARQILEDAGYTEGSDGFYAKDGQPVAMTLSSVDGWSDYNSAAKLIEEQAAEAGIKITASTFSWNEYSDARQTGSYELILGGMIASPVADPYSIYEDWFTTASTAPVGEELQPGDWNFSRYSNPDVDAAVIAASQTNDEAAKLEQYAVIQENIVRDLPYIPLVINGTQSFFNTEDFTGWPTEEDMYTFPPAWGATSSGIVLAHLKPAE
ncbi:MULTISPECIES: ABC transporter substrate-binding protein [unclassified Actinotalea]|uniref:ABC transporter substrate-binding protein n=1 Tax=unclassified Actinotalea TaxID=2638618 RepID=UPI0015F76527|nr:MULTISPECIES: ABC transporter substrate-binding protein [unclassified Actinotalea]